MTMPVVAAPPPQHGVLPGLPIAAGPAHLLPPVSPTLDLGTALGELLKLESASHQMRADRATSDAGVKQALRKDATERRTELLQKAVEAAQKAAEAREDGGLFDFITDNLGPVGLVGLVTGGAFLVAADWAAHASGLENSELDLADAAGLGAMLAGPAGVALHAAQLCVKKFGPDDLQRDLSLIGTIQDDSVRKFNELALAATQAQLTLAVTAASCGTAAPFVVATVGISLSMTTQVLQEVGVLRKMFGDDASGVALGGTLAGTALTVGGGLAAGNAKDVLGLLATSKMLAQSTFDIEQGLSNLAAAGYQHDSDHFAIDAKQQKYVVEMFERMIDRAIEELETVQSCAKKTTALCQSMTQTHQLTLLTSSSLKG